MEVNLKLSMDDAKTLYREMDRFLEMYSYSLNHYNERYRLIKQGHVVDDINEINKTLNRLNTQIDELTNISSLLFNEMQEVKKNNG